MKYIEFYKVELNGHTYLFKEKEEVYDYWNDEDTQNYAVYNGETELFRRDNFLSKKDQFIFSESAENMVGSIYNEDQ